jgi:hypothetical protein
VGRATRAALPRSRTADLRAEQRAFLGPFPRTGLHAGAQAVTVAVTVTVTVTVWTWPCQGNRQGNSHGGIEDTVEPNFQESFSNFKRQAGIFLGMKGFSFGMIFKPAEAQLTGFRKSICFFGFSLQFHVQCVSPSNLNVLISHCSRHTVPKEKFLITVALSNANMDWYQLLLHEYQLQILLHHESDFEEHNNINFSVKQGTIRKSLKGRLHAPSEHQRMVNRIKIAVPELEAEAYAVLTPPMA